MSLNPILLEMMAKDRQRELLAMARPHAIPVPAEKRRWGRGNPLWAAARLGLAQLLIRIGLRLKPSGSVPACPMYRGKAFLSLEGAAWRCGCPKRGSFPACPPLHSG